MLTLNISSDKTHLPQLASSIIRDLGRTLPMNCGGNHTCGKCKITVASGNENVSAMTMDEKHFLSDTEISANVRLACFATIKGDCTILINADVDDYIIHTDFVKDNPSQRDGVGEGYYIAVDIGTTTIVSYLCAEKSGEILSTVGEMNSQSSYGADVISRIDYTNHNSESKLHLAILNQLDKMFGENISKSNVRMDKKDITKLVVTGNTTMLHFLMDYPSFGIAVSPFTPHSLFDESHRATALFDGYDGAELYLPPCIGSYVGADTVCAILASGMVEPERKGIHLLADIGTNGEMALWADGRLYTCSTAAGPAFEGAGIKMGMPAKSGAISDVFLSDGKVCYTTIGDKEATGICGTGIIKTLALFLSLGLIDFSGAINDEAEGDCAKLIGYDENDEPYIKIGDSNVIFTGRDIRQTQLAKAAIHAGILTLCNECNISPEQVDRFYLCGGFGSVISPNASAQIGLIPEAFARKSTPLGNGAGLGALMIAQSMGNLNKARKIKEMAVEIPLSTNKYFMEQYVEQMMFGE